MTAGFSKKAAAAHLKKDPILAKIMNAKIKFVVREERNLFPAIVRNIIANNFPEKPLIQWLMESLQQPGKPLSLGSAG